MVFLVLLGAWSTLAPRPLPKRGPFVSCEWSTSSVAYSCSDSLPVRRAIEAAETIVAGDSRLNVGISEPILSEKTGSPVSILARPANRGGQLVSLTGYLLALPPRRLILAFSPASIFRNQKGEALPGQTDWMLSRKVFDDTINMMTDRIRSRLVRPLTFEHGFYDHNQLEFYFSPLTLYGVAYPVSYRPRSCNKPYTTHLAEGREEREQNLPLLEKNLAQLKEKGWDIVCIRMPTFHELREIEENAFPGEKFEGLCRRLDLLYFDYSRTGFITYDGTHMDAYQAEAFSNLLGDDLREKAGWR